MAPSTEQQPASSSSTPSDWLPFEDIAVKVFPRNLKNGSEVLLFPFPWSFKEVPSTSKRFLVAIAFRPNKAGFEIDPAQIQFIGSSMEIVKPTRIYGPSVCGKSSSTLPQTLPIGPIALPQGICTGFGLEFPVPAPDPSETFSVQIAGLTEVTAVSHIIPVVHFHEQRRLDPFGAP